MKSSLINFSYENKNLRTETIKNEPYFCLSDVLEILGLKHFRTQRLSEDGVIQNQVIDNLGRNQKTNFINEPNLYRVIFRSDKPEAKRFQDWVFNDVLPTIRKSGKYESADLKSVPKKRAEKKAITSERVENAENEVYFDNGAFIVRCKNTIYHWFGSGDILIFKPAEKIENTGLYLLRSGDTYVMRHLYQNGDTVRVVGYYDKTIGKRDLNRLSDANLSLVGYFESRIKSNQKQSV